MHLKESNYHVKYEHMWQLGTCFFSEHGSDGLMIGLNDLKDLFQPERFSGFVSLDK